MQKHKILSVLVLLLGIGTSIIVSVSKFLFKINKEVMVMEYTIYNVLDISRYIINKCNDENIIISNLKLQKLLYFVQGFNYAFSNHRCFDDQIQAWDYGPVCPEAYHEFKKYGANNIPPILQYETIEFVDDNIEWVCKKYNPNIIDAETRETIDAVIDNYGSYSATRLVEITHSQVPWRETYYSHPGEKNVTIDENIIQDYFTKILSEIN